MGSSRGFCASARPTSCQKRCTRCVDGGYPYCLVFTQYAMNTRIATNIVTMCNHQTIEYLLRVCRIDLYNADELIGAALPYHSSELFGRILLLLNTQCVGFCYCLYKSYPRYCLENC